MSDSFPVLYILMRGDLASMNTGKAMAQASHASNAFVFAELKKMLSSPWKSVKDFYKVFIKGETENASLFIQWVHSTTQGFGTVLVLKVNEIEMRTAVRVAGYLGHVSGVVHDPTYPILIPREFGNYITDNMLDQKGLAIGEGGGYAMIPLDTCAYVFGNKNDPLLGAVVSNFPLHP
jgi:hypothetical protein